jgi:hypothetical protein
MIFPVQVITTSGTGFPALSVQVADSGVPPVTYQQVKQSLGAQVYKIHELYLYSENINQLLGVIQYQRFDSDGNQKFSSIATTIDPYSGNAIAIDVDLDRYEEDFILNGNSSFSAVILPDTYLQVKFWATRITNEFGRNLNNFEQIQIDANRPYFFNNYGSTIPLIKQSNALIEKTATLDNVDSDKVFADELPIAAPDTPIQEKQPLKKIFILGLAAAVLGGLLIGGDKKD